MKVKSIVDVITNSSSEVFIAKTEDVKACFLELLGDDILPKIIIILQRHLKKFLKILMRVMKIED